MKMIGFRYSATGVFGYAYYRGGRRICTADSLVAPSPTVHIHGFDRDWTSPFDQDSTLFPGLTRYVYRVDSGQEECRVVYRGDRYDLQIGADVYHVRPADGGYVFYAGKEPIAVIRRMSPQEAEQISLPQDETCYDLRAYGGIEAAEGIAENVLLAVLAFPMVRFGTI